VGTTTLLEGIGSERERERERKKKENGKCGMDAQELTFGDSYMPSYVYV
jgi:hypothetical protein